MSEWPIDKTLALDGIVGLPLEPNGALQTVSSPDSQLRVSVSGDALTEPWAMGLEDDVRLLAQAFAAGGVSLCREMTEHLVTRSAGQSPPPDENKDVDVQFSPDSGVDDDLRDLIRMLIRERIARSGARK
jgi:hypothetical protein